MATRRPRLPNRALAWSSMLHPLLALEETPKDAFGAVGGMEPESFVFRTGGVIDNGNLILGDGETVDFLRLETEFLITLDGYSLHLPPDYGQ